VIEAQARLIEELRIEVAELKRQLGRNSRNSSQPPSADGPATPLSRSTRRRSGRRPGKQPGAGGSALLRVGNPDEVIDHVPDVCAGCGAGLVGAAGAEAGAPPGPRHPDDHTVRSRAPDAPPALRLRSGEHRGGPTRSGRGGGVRPVMPSSA
jgi:hypothetical protein